MTAGSSLRTMCRISDGSRWVRSMAANAARQRERAGALLALTTGCSGLGDLGTTDGGISAPAPAGFPVAPRAARRRRSPDCPPTEERGEPAIKRLRHRARKSRHRQWRASLRTATLPRNGRAQEVEVKVRSGDLAKDSSRPHHHDILMPATDPAPHLVPLVTHLRAQTRSIPNA